MPDTPELLWRSLYRSAILETDDSKLLERINLAETAIRHRIESLNGQPHEKEAHALEDAINGLRVLRTERP